jgi:hypothetical protein
MLKREDGARFKATIQTTSDGPQAAWDGFIPAFYLDV